MSFFSHPFGKMSVLKKVWSMLRFQVVFLSKVHNLVNSKFKVVIFYVTNIGILVVVSKCSWTHSNQNLRAVFSTLLGLNISKDISDYHFCTRVYLILIVMTSRRYVFCSQSTTRSFDFMFVFSSLNKYVIQSCVVR